MSDLPIIDFSRFDEAAAQKSIAAQIDAACRDTGFFYLRGHGIPDATIAAAFDAAKRFFDLPTAEKAAIAIENSPCHRGWFATGGEVLDPESHPEGDMKEGIKIGNECGADHPRVRQGLPLHGLNQWPELADFRAPMETYYKAANTLGRRLMSGFALALELPPDFFAPWLTEPMATLGPLRYPPLPDGHLSAGAHTDFGCLTLLAQDETPGLEVAHNDGWKLVPPLADTLVVNIGDMLARWSNDRYASTRHRVVNRTQNTRHALAFFFDPDPEADLSPLGLAAGETPHYPPATGLSHLLDKIDASFAYRRKAR